LILGSKKDIKNRCLNMKLIVYYILGLFFVIVEQEVSKILLQISINKIQEKEYLEVFV